MVLSQARHAVQTAKSRQKIHHANFQYDSVPSGNEVHGTKHLTADRKMIQLITTSTSVTMVERLTVF